MTQNIADKKRKVTFLLILLPIIIAGLVTGGTLAGLALQTSFPGSPPLLLPLGLALAGLAASLLISYAIAKFVI